MNTNESGVNTLLLVVVIALMIGGGVWAFNKYQSAPQEEAASITVTIPAVSDTAGE
jgi:uncharacterized protein HemX